MVQVKLRSFLFGGRELIYRNTTSLVMINATIVRAHACSAGYGRETQPQQALGRSREGFSTKIHALVDALRNPLKFILSAGQRHEISQADALIENIWDQLL